MKIIKAKYLRLTFLIIGGAFLLGACAKPAAEAAPAPVVDVPLPAPEEDLATPLAEDTAPTDVDMPQDGEILDQAVTVAEGMPVGLRVIPREEYADIEQEPEWTVHPDSVSYLYMIRPDDYLSKIAWEEYGNPNEWRRIYRWNRERIGDDPNLIFPYHELALYKPQNEISDWSYDYIIHLVKSGESLWSIAGSEYGDEIAWAVIFWDNEEILNANSGMLKPGMELRIRTELWSAN